MKILHTSDWHLNRMLGRHSRNDDLCRSLQQIRDYLEEYHVDVMLVSGDLFRERSRPEQMQAGVEIIKTHFQPFIQRGGTIIAISGNHDSEIFFTTLRDALDLVAPPIGSHADTHASGRLYLAPNASLLKLTDHDGQVVQFVLMPYPSTRYLRGERDMHFQTPEERNRAIEETFKRILHTLQGRLEPQWPAILVSHILVRGMITSSHHHPDESDEVRLEASDLSFPWTYVALGHMHRPQEALTGASHMRYAGSIERLDYGERDDPKSVVFLEIDKGRLVGVPQLLSLQSTTFYKIEVNDPETEIPHLEEQYPDKKALVHYILHWDSSTQDRERYCQEIEKMFPRWYHREVKDTYKGTITESNLAIHQSRDIVGTTRMYLQTQLTKHEACEELLQLAEQLFVEEGLI